MSVPPFPGGINGRPGQDTYCPAGSILPQKYRKPGMDFGRIVLNIGFWIVFSFVFDAVSGALFPDLSLEMYIYLLFFGLCAGTILFNLAWYWFRIRR
jgi:hypothetical protein